MRIVRLKISNFRCIRSAELLPTKHNVYLGPNNSGKTAVMEALNLLLNPESGYRSDVIDENDFYRRRYLSTNSIAGGANSLDPATQANAVASIS